MDDEIRYFIEYLKDVKRASHNTVMSYQSDLAKMALYVSQQGVESIGGVTATVLGSYVLFLERSGMAAATISRYIASMKAFFEYLMRNHKILEDPAFQLKAPKVEKRKPGILTIAEMELLLEQPSADNPKGYRDKAMLELLYKERERMVPFGEDAKKALVEYLEKGRKTFLKKEEKDLLFLNCAGAPLSRQGFWKVLKSYAKKAGIEKDITPRMFRHSCAAHMASNGANLQTIQEMLGYSDMAATQIYAGFQPGVKTEYTKVHPRG